MEPAAVLAGRWAVRRRLVDLHAGVEGEFTGVASFVPSGAGLRWDERGWLRLGSYDGPAGRRLFVLRTGDGWAVEFADGRPFHPLDLTGACVEHLCGEDVYRGSYRLLDPDRLEVRWSVDGPGKRQRIHSSYERSGAPRYGARACRTSELPTRSENRPSSSCGTPQPRAG